MTSPIDETPDARRLDGQLLSDLWIFRAAVRHGSLTAAAQKLGITQGAVSQRVSRLEARLGTQLFLRQKGRLILTDEGKSVFDAMTDVALTLNDCLSRTERMHRSALVVSCVPSVATEWLVPNLQNFYDHHPGIEIFVRAELAPSTPERLDSDAIDLVIDYQPEPANDLHQLAELQEVIFPVCSPSYRDRLESAPVLLQDDLTCWNMPADYDWKIWRAATHANWPGRSATVRHFNLAHLAYHAAMMGQGVAMGRALIVNRLLTNGELIPAVEMAPVSGSVYRLLTNRPGDARSAVRKFASWCSEAMAATQAATLSLLSVDRQSAD